MYAIVKAGGRQVRVEPKATIKVDRLPQTVGDSVEFSEVLAVHNGTDLTVGAPLVEGAKVVGRVVAEGRDRKVRVRTFRRKKRTRRRLGHRQHHTMVEILSIEAEQLEDVEEEEEHGEEEEHEEDEEHGEHEEEDDDEGDDEEEDDDEEDEE
jgi:large subunit ribosomal protein L21